jgi:hypothetical protein
VGTPWQENFTYAYLEKLLQTTKNNFSIHLLKEAANIISKDFYQKPIIFIRHDVDLDLNAALKIARIENKLDIQATYMFMVRSPLYSLDKEANKKIISEIIALNHDVGLHWDIYTALNSYKKSYEEQISLDCAYMEELIDYRVKSVSFHRPINELLRGPLKVANRINAYANELMDWYLSDSKGIWREGEPIPKLDKPIKNMLQLLVHPIWWGENHELPEDRLQHFFEYKTSSYDYAEKRLFDHALQSQLSIQRRGQGVEVR